MPDSLEQVLANARAQLETSPRGELVLGQRQLIWAAMGPRSTGNYVRVELGNPAHIRRTRLAVACLARVVPFWSALPWEDDDTLRHVESGLVEDIMHLAVSFVDGHVQLSKLEGSSSELEYCIENMENDDPDPALGVAWAAIETARTAIRDTYFVEGGIDPELEDDEVFCEQNSYEAAYSAAWVFAGCALDSGKTIVDRQRAFWRWYLSEAVPYISKHF